MMGVQLKKQQTNKDNSQYFKKIRGGKILIIKFYNLFHPSAKKSYGKPNEHVTKLNEINTVLLWRLMKELLIKAWLALSYP